MAEDNVKIKSLREHAEDFGVDPARAEVWEAFSDLFLDMEPTESDLEWIAKTLAGSPFSFRELGHILFKEVGPVCVGNLYAIPGGVWTGFAPEWLLPKCLERHRKYPFQETANLDEIPFLYRVLSPVFSDAYKMLLRVKEMRR